MLVVYNWFIALIGESGSSSLLLILVLVGIGLHLLVVQLAASVLHRLLDGLAGSFQELTFFQLNIALVLLAIDVWDQERGHQVLDQLLWLVASVLNLVQEFVDRLNLELGLVVGLA